MILTHPFEAIYDENTEILILGSFPSVISRENDFYYGNPKNRFWKLFERLFDINFTSLTKKEKKMELQKKHIGLYDAVYSCEIIGSSDASIKNIVYSDISSIVAQSKIRIILCNGKKAYDVFLKGNPQFRDITYVLPSTSPANAIFTLDKLYEKWSSIIE